MVRLLCPCSPQRTRVDWPAAHGGSHTGAGECALRIYIAGTACAGACSWQELRCVMSTHRIKFSCKNYNLWEIHPRAVLEELQPVERTHIVLWGDYNPYSIHPAPPRQEEVENLSIRLREGRRRGWERCFQFCLISHYPTLLLICNKLISIKSDFFC